MKIYDKFYDKIKRIYICIAKVPNCESYNDKKECDNCMDTYDKYSTDNGMKCRKIVENCITYHQDGNCIACK